MSYTNSGLVTFTRISPNKTVPRNHSIDRITPHCYVGQVTVEDMGAWFAQTSEPASSNYGIGKDGKVGLFVEEKDRSWCSSSKENDNRAVTIECASDKSDPYAINAVVYNRLIELMTDICRRNGKDCLLWFGDKEKTLAYQPKPNEMVMTVHRWFANKACPGSYIYNRLPAIAEAVTRALGGDPAPTADRYVVRLTFDQPQTQTNSFNNLDLAKREADRYPGYSVYVQETGECIYTSQKTTGYTPEEWINMIAPICQELGEKNAILPSVVIAQTALETGWGSTDLTRKYNVLGMKADLINSTWKEYSVWDGEKYSKITPEYRDGKLVYVEDVFRVYRTFRQCIEDYEAFLLHVRNDKGYKYRRLQGLTNPAEVINIIRVGTGTNAKPEGYCTDPAYETKIMNIISQYNLTRFDGVRKATVVDCMESYQAQLAADIKAGKKWIYSNSGCAKTFKQAVNKGNRQANCATIANWALKEIGILDNDMYFYGHDGGYIQCSDETMARLKEKCTLIDIRGRLAVDCVKDGTLKAGDIVCHMGQHTNVYGGGNTWYDAGRGNCEGDADPGAIFLRWKCTKKNDESVLAWIIRVGKSADFMNRVQVGAFQSKAKADKRAAEVKKKTAELRKKHPELAKEIPEAGFDCFVEKSDWYRVYCGSFSSEANAERRKELVRMAGIEDAFIVKKNNIY